MNDPTPELQPSVSQVVADALRTAAEGLSRWLEHPIHTTELGATRVNLDAAKASFAKPNEMLCCSTMPVEIGGSPHDLAELCEPTSSESVSESTQSGTTGVVGDNARSLASSCALYAAAALSAAALSPSGSFEGVSLTASLGDVVTANASASDFVVAVAPCSARSPR